MAESEPRRCRCCGVPGIGLLVPVPSISRRPHRRTARTQSCWPRRKLSPCDMPARAIRRTPGHPGSRKSRPCSYSFRRPSITPHACSAAERATSGATLPEPWIRCCRRKRTRSKMRTSNGAVIMSRLARMPACGQSAALALSRHDRSASSSDTASCRRKISSPCSHAGPKGGPAPGRPPPRGIQAPVGLAEWTGW